LLYLNEWIGSLRIPRNKRWWRSTTDILAQSQLDFLLPMTHKQNAFIKEAIWIDITTKRL
jgi:hypothetical protein